MLCKNCGCEHDGSYGSGIFCSSHCRYSFIAKQVKHHVCNFKYIEKGYGTWYCKRCNEIFRTRKLLQEHYKINHNKIPWNKGLTKETNASLLKASMTYRKNFEEGKYTKIIYNHTKEIKEQLSKIRSEQIANGIHGGFNDIPWLKINNLKGEECSVRGNWELWTAEYLNTHNINWSRNKFLNYTLSDGILRIYNPDFYLDDLDIYIEVKGYFSEKDKNKIECVLKQNNIKLLWIDNSVIDKIKNNSIMFSDIPFYRI